MTHERVGSPVLPWIVPCEGPDIAAIFEAHGRELHVPRGSLIRLGGDSSNVLLLKRGLCATYMDDGYVPSQILSLYGAGSSLGTSKCVSYSNVRLHARALRDVRAIAVCATEFRKSITQNRQLALAAAHSAMAKKASQVEGLVCNLGLDASERLRTLLWALILAYRGEIAPGWNLLPLLLSNEEYASVAHLVRVTVSKVFSRWTASGDLRKRGRQIEVHSRLFDSIR